MQVSGYKERALTAALLRIVKTSCNGDLSVENIRRLLNESGITREHGISCNDMLECLALVLHQLNIRRADNHLRQALIYFIADYPVFRWSELRYSLPSDLKQDIEAILNELKYTRRELEIDGEREYVWSSRWLLESTVRKRLARRDRVGDPAFFMFLNYKPAR